MGIAAMAALADLLFALPQYALPHHPLSRLMGYATHSRNRLWKNLFIHWFVHHYRVGMDEAEQADAVAYSCFNDFFTRALKPAVRPLSSEPGTLLSPADGTVSQIGRIDGEAIIQAKGKRFGVTALLGGDQREAERFRGGRFATIYLSPRDYHRVHMPMAGRLRTMTHVPGRLFSVNAATTASVPQLFARNERVIALFETEAGPMALVLVGALFVASIETVWHGVVTPPAGRRIRTWRYEDTAPLLQRGEEMGRFNMGSTVIVLFPDYGVEWSRGLFPGGAIRMGETIGTVTMAGSMSWSAQREADRGNRQSALAP
jgi:phosphatidylserine decarboxylase